MNDKPEKFKSLADLHQLTGEYWADIQKAPHEGRPVAWSSVLGPADLLTTMGFSVVYPENYAAVCGGRKVSTEFCQIAENNDFSPDLCSYAKNGIGSVLAANKDLCPVGGLPNPDVLVASTYCTAIVMWFEELSRIFDVPLVIIDLPLLRSEAEDDEAKRAIAYLKKQMEDEIILLESLTGKKFDYDLLAQKCEYTDEMSRLWQDIIKSAKNIPSPITVFDVFSHMLPITCFRGEPKGVAYYKQLLAELNDRVARGVAAVPNERYRLYWDNIAIWYKLKELSMEFASYGACLVTGIYPNTFIWHTDAAAPSQPLDYVANVVARALGSMPVENRVQRIAEYVRDYSIDGLIMQSSRTCKIMSQAQPTVLELVEKETGVPGVIIEADMCDSRMYSEAQINMRIKAFMELLENTKKK